MANHLDNHKVQANLPSIFHFEQATINKDYESACQELLKILDKLDTNFGYIHDIEFDFPNQLSMLDKERTIYFCTRIADITTQLFKDPGLNISLSGSVRFFTMQRWLSLIFASSPYINADHILKTYNVDLTFNAPINSENFSKVIKFCILYLSESNIDINLNTIWQYSPELCASLCFAIQSPRFIGTEGAFNKRRVVLQWLPSMLGELTSLDNLPGNISHDVYMHCSYDMNKDKHLVKKSLNKIIRSHLLSGGWEDRNISSISKCNGKPIMLVLLEHFNSSHSIYRTHSTSMIAAREHFHLIGMGSNKVDEVGKQVFDEFYTIEVSNVFDKLKYIRQIAEQNNIAVFYMPSIGMDLTTIFASNTRLAPIQAVALGHPATTYSDFIEYVIVEEDYVGSETCFSETLLRLPKDALPYVPSSEAPQSVEYQLRENPEVVNIGIASTTMKLNPHFLEACRAIRDTAKVKVHFHFALGHCMGINYPYVSRFIKSYLGDCATVNAHKPYKEYLAILSHCDMMINPFPFGNTNGIIDMVTLGLVGVCKTGDEVHEHIDEGLFKRLGLPEWLIAKTVEEYIERAVRLAENHQERLVLRKHIIQNNGLQTLFTGDPRPLGQVLYQKVQEIFSSEEASQARKR